MTAESGNPAAPADAPAFGFQPGGFLFVVSGPSGAGKGTLVEHLIQARPECVFSISSTTRPRRVSEADGVQYEFVTREEFERRRSAGHFLEWAEVHGNLYGTPAPFVDEHVRAGRIVVLDVDVQGGASVRRARPDAVSAFILPPSIDALRQRLLARGTDAADVVERRLLAAPREIAQFQEYEYVVLNDDVHRACERLTAIVDAERARVRRLRARPDLGTV